MIFLLSLPLDGAELYLRDRERLVASFDLVDLRLDDPEIPPLFSAYLPDGMAELHYADRITLFIKVLLPIILRENRRIANERTRLAGLAEAQALTDDDRRWLRRTAIRHFSLKENEVIPQDTLERKNFIERLLLKVAPLHPAIVIAVAALESGWGTSRFSHEANNIFGHTAVYPWKGLAPRNWRGTNRNMRRFETIGHSLARFMLNLNRNRAYRLFRRLRAQRPDDPYTQAAGFGNYSRIGPLYIERLRQILLKYDLARFGPYRLAGEERLYGADRLNTPYLY